MGEPINGHAILWGVPEKNEPVVYFKGGFAPSIGSTVAFMWNHQKMGELLGWVNLYGEDDQGLLYQGELLESASWVADAFRTYARVTGEGEPRGSLSVSFLPGEFLPAPAPFEDLFTPVGNEVYEVSFTPWPAVAGSEGYLAETAAKMRYNILKIGG